MMYKVQKTYGDPPKWGDICVEGTWSYCQGWVDCADAMYLAKGIRHRVVSRIRPEEPVKDQAV
jgi:hypothetical protein